MIPIVLPWRFICFLIMSNIGVAMILLVIYKNKNSKYVENKERL